MGKKYSVLQYIISQYLRYHNIVIISYRGAWVDSHHCSVVGRNLHCLVVRQWFCQTTLYGLLCQGHIPVISFDINIP